MPYSFIVIITRPSDSPALRCAWNFVRSLDDADVAGGGGGEGECSQEDGECVSDGDCCQGTCDGEVCTAGGGGGEVFLIDMRDPSMQRALRLHNENPSRIYAKLSTGGGERYATTLHTNISSLCGKLSAHALMLVGPVPSFCMPSSCFKRRRHLY